MSKLCSFCNESINEYDSDVKWTMIITKKGQRVIEFACFHLFCWKEFFDKSVKIKMAEM
jgi:hypothetical protein